jgi:hypothetical protein
MIKQIRTYFKSATFRRIYSYVVVVGMPLGAIVLLLLPADYFNTGQSLCVSVLLFDTSCYGCGMTRAIMHMIHFDFSSAWEFNPLSFIVFPLASYYLFKEWWGCLQTILLKAEK